MAVHFYCDPDYFVVLPELVVLPVAFPLDVPPVDGIELELDVVLPGWEVELFDGYVELPGFEVELVSLGEELTLDELLGDEFMLDVVSPEADVPERLPALLCEELPDEVDAVSDPETPSAARVCESS